MQKLMNVVTRHLLAAANARAQWVTERVAAPAVTQDAVYRSNMGGWN
jgi:hypothetical protein